MKEVRIEARVRNNVLWHAIFDRWKNVSVFCREQEFSEQEVGQLLNLKGQPTLRNGDYTRTAMRLSIFFRMLPEDLFPPELYRIRQPFGVVEVSIAALPAAQQIGLLPSPQTPFEEVVDHEMRQGVRKAIERLTPRQAEVIRRRFYEEETLEEIAEDFGVCRDRIRQIEKKAMLRLRGPGVSKTLKPFSYKEKD